MSTCTCISHTHMYMCMYMHVYVYWYRTQTNCYTCTSQQVQPCMIIVYTVDTFILGSGRYIPVSYPPYWHTCTCKFKAQRSYPLVCTPSWLVQQVTSHTLSRNWWEHAGFADDIIWPSVITSVCSICFYTEPTRTLTPDLSLISIVWTQILQQVELMGTDNRLSDGQ